MFVRTLIGRAAGSIIEMPYHAATACFAVGTAERVTDEEIAAAGLIQDTRPVVDPEQFPDGYRAEPEEWGGFYVLDPGGVTLNERPFPNLAAARSFAHEHANPPPTPERELTDEEKALLENTRAVLEEMATARGIDFSKAKTKGDIVALLLAAPVPPPVVDLKTLTHDELVKLAGERAVDLTGMDKDEDIVAALELAAETAKAT